MCSEPEHALDPSAFALLRDLEHHLAEDVLAPSVPAHEDGWFNALEVRQLLRKYPATEMVFLFASQIQLPAGDYRARSGERQDDIDHASAPTFFMRITNVAMVDRGQQIALILDYASAPRGPTPKGVAAWAWGVLGRFCAIPGPRGTWRAFPMGGVVVS